VLDDLIAEFRKRGETIPSEIMDDLRSAKSLIHISSASPSASRESTKIEAYLSNVEVYLMSKAQEFGNRFAEKWMKGLETARAEAIEEFTTNPNTSKFLPGIPKGTAWVRVKISEDISRDSAKAMARESGLLTNNIEKGYLLVYGQRERIQIFIRKMSEKLHGAKQL
jgi:hypothetical protein